MPTTLDGYYSIFKDDILELWSDDISKIELARIIRDRYPDEDINVETLSRYITKVLKHEIADKELIHENVRYKKEKQKHQDLTRIERKSFREYARVENAVSKYAKELVNIYKDHGVKLNKYKQKQNPKITGGVGVIQITDTHCNELVDLEHNTYNFSVFSRRLKHYISECLDYFRYKEASSIVVAFTGDLINSDRRLDELLSMSTNRAKATALTTHIFKQALIDVCNFGLPVKVVGVMGNESRVKPEMTFANHVISDNYDFTILAALHQTFDASDFDIDFIRYDVMELVLDIENQKWLIAHDVSKLTDKQDKAQSAIGRYSLSGNKIDFIIGGHIHAFRATDISCRSGSMVGSNTYNEHALNLAGRASGVCYYVKGNNKSIQYIDLQNPPSVGYEFEKWADVYNIKSKAKLRKGETIFRVVV